MRKVPTASADSEALLTRNVCIDTSEYVATRFAFEGPSFRRLTELAAADVLRVYITPIIRREVDSNIGEAAQTMANAVQQLRQKAAQLREVTLPSVQQFFAAYERDDVIQHLQRHFDAFLNQAKVTSIPIIGVDAEQVFEAYFGRRSPFGTGKKKAEFPDAFIVASLDRWCREHEQKMYVITGDGVEREAAFEGGTAKNKSSEESEGQKSMTSACKETTTLIPLARLAEFLDLVNKEEAKRLGTLRSDAALLWFSNERHFLADQVSEAFASLDFEPDDFEAEIQGIEVLGVDVDEPELVDVDEDTASLSFLATVQYRATLRTLDPESGIWNSEDKVMLFQERRRIRSRHSTEVEVELVVDFPLQSSLGPKTTVESLSLAMDFDSLEILTGSVEVPTDADFAEEGEDPAQLRFLD